VKSPSSTKKKKGKRGKKKRINVYYTSWVPLENIRREGKEKFLILSLDFQRIFYHGKKGKGEREI